MNNLFNKIRSWARGFLLKLAKDLKASESKGPVIRESKSLFQKEIKIPVFISFIFTIIVVYGMLVMGVGIDSKIMFAALIFMVAVVIFFASQIQNKERAILEDNDAVVLMCLLFITAILTFQISKEYLSPFASPVSAFSIMAAMLLSSRLGGVYAVCLSLYTAFLNDMRFDIFLTMLGSAIFVVANVHTIRRRSDFINVGAKTIIANSALLTMFYLIGIYSSFQLKYNLFYGVLNGIFSVIILLVLMPLFEKIFSRTTNIKLIELSDFNNPLLKCLMLEAPGTYHHSIMTADIAEQAANAVGENSLLARVGSYYHDIGKLKNPMYFIENQTSGYNPHDNLNPEMSRLILISHVKEGVVLAKKHNVDNEIINIIKQHHGTTVMHAFYHRALESGLHMDMEHFRYPGPKPSTKIGAVIMLADSCEAACRSIEEPTTARIKDMVEKIINNKFIDGQFSVCPITLKDLELMRDSIISTITGIYHARIEYK
ncbi:HD family phosphohydrolase [Candidatus Endomicrobiellum devescovinae]|jgi:putative nucleotidyltransferase with HDIG domain|uniref:HD family phosphohydrolase n=1 Tax=Candidatus Endomicrobiellum devescovinae TaxID=3242322 RepID=UPI0028219E48|nr:HDIG domain-containing protein [Endomicrobium sp.]MDR1434521.1 HDIG domain-containing protein [Endomicrobium sp.]